LKNIIPKFFVSLTSSLILVIKKKKELISFSRFVGKNGNQNPTSTRLASICQFYLFADKKE